MGYLPKGPLTEKSYRFSLRVIKLYKHLVDRKEYILSKQILRSGTSVGANIHESQAAQSQKDFLAKLYISFKESYETQYWINLLKDSNYITEEQFTSLDNDITEIIKILTSIIKKINNNQK